MMNSNKPFLTLVTCFVSLLLMSCGDNQNVRTPKTPEIETLIINGIVHVGDMSEGSSLTVGIADEKIVYLGEAPLNIEHIPNVIDAKGKLVTPGFIDPHTHSFSDLVNKDKNHNLNYLTQGVTTVFNGNDGGGKPDVSAQFQKLNEKGIGTNTALFVGHGAVRQQVMGRTDRAATPDEMQQMKGLIEQAMQQGALGLSTGLFYVPGTYASREEVVELAKIAAQYGGVYESHIRDESSYNIGVEAAVAEAIQIGWDAGIPVHLAHIKALGVDVWGKSKEIVQLIEQAHQHGQIVTADQYPWRASGVRIHKATVPSWALAGTEEEIQARFKDTSLLPQIKTEMAENIRRRGGPESLLIVTSSQKEFEGKTLAELAQGWQLDAVDAAIKVISYGVTKNGTRVASFNMSPEDIEHFMVQPWVMTSSDGTNGHPRKYASFPTKFQEYVINKELLSITEFVYKSTGQVAETFKLEKRGFLRPDYYADINIWSPEEFQANADFSKWNVLSGGIEFQWVNGELTLERGEYTGVLPGKTLKKSTIPMYAKEQ